MAGFKIAKRSDSVETMKCAKNEDRCYLHLQLFLPRVHCPFTEGDLLRDECKAFYFLASVAARAFSIALQEVHPDRNVGIGNKASLPFDWGPIKIIMQGNRRAAATSVVGPLGMSSDQSCPEASECHQIEKKQ